MVFESDILSAELAEILYENAFPREVLIEAIVRYVEEDLNNIQQIRSESK